MLIAIVIADFSKSSIIDFIHNNQCCFGLMTINIECHFGSASLTTLEAIGSLVSPFI